MPGRAAPNFCRGLWRSPHAKPSARARAMRQRPAYLGDLFESWAAASDCNRSRVEPLPVLLQYWIQIRASFKFPRLSAKHKVIGSKSTIQSKVFNNIG